MKLLTLSVEEEIVILYEDITTAMEETITKPSIVMEDQNVKKIEETKDKLDS